MEKRGAEWRKWDLHLHTPKTWLNGSGYKNTNDEDFVKKVINSDIKVVGLTNYFHFAAGEIEGDNNIKAQLESHGISVFPNIEFRINQPNNKHEHINIHILFSNTIEPKKISDFLNRIETMNGAYCNDISPSDMDKALVEEKTLFDAISKDCSLKHLRDFIVIGCPNGLGGFHPGKDGRSVTVAITLDNASDAFFASKMQPERDRDFFLGGRGNGLDPKTVFLCSDAHDIEEIGKTFTWVKAQRNFDGLIQVLSSPKDRVNFDINSPAEYKSQGMIIDKIAYGQKDCEPSEILFNQDLVSIIGARGNGKSMLLKAIAIKASPNEYKSKVSEAQFTKDMAWTERQFPNLSVIWKDGEKNAGSDTKPKKVFFIPQGYLSNLAYDENEKEKERDEFLVSLLRKNNRFSNAEKHASDFRDANSIQIKKNLSEVIANTENIKRLKEENDEIGGAVSIADGIKTLKGKINALSSQHNITEDDKNSYREANRSKDEDGKKLEVIQQDIKILREISRNMDLVVVDDYALVGLSIQLKQDISNQFREKGKDAWASIIPGQIQKLASQEENLIEKIKKTEEVLVRLRPKFERQQELEKLIRQEAILVRNQEKLESNTEEIANKEKRNDYLFDSLKNDYFNFEKQQKQYFDTVRLDDFDFIKIEIAMGTDYELCSSFIERNINKIKNRSGLRDETKEFISSEHPAITQGNLIPILKDIIEEKITLLKTVQGKKVVAEQLLENPYHIDFLNSIKLKDGDVIFRDMTGGQKAITMLELIFKLDNNKCPILLDQPEDDLDASGIANNIVEFIRSQKEDRQVIIVSHNANLVVCSDSEEIIVAHCNGKHFSYTSGAIEDPKRRQDIIDILEGGKQALALRMKRLRVR